MVIPFDLQAIQKPKFYLSRPNYKNESRVYALGLSRQALLSYRNTPEHFKIRWGFFCDCREPVGVWQPSPETDDTGESKGSNKQLQQKALVTYTAILQNKLHVRMHNNQCTRQISHIGELCVDNTR